jgi:hypothetical protein
MRRHRPHRCLAIKLPGWLAADNRSTRTAGLRPTHCLGPAQGLVMLDTALRRRGCTSERAGQVVLQMHLEHLQLTSILCQV